MRVMLRRVEIEKVAWSDADAVRRLVAATNAAYGGSTRRGCTR